MLSEHANVLSSPRCTCYVNKPATQHGLDGIGLHWDACQGKKTRERMDVGEEWYKWGGEKDGRSCVEQHTEKQKEKSRSAEGRWNGTGCACRDYTGTTGNIWMRWKTRHHLVFHSCLQRLGLCSLYTHTNAHWQSEAKACGCSSVTAACSQGGDASGVAPRIGEACLCWPWINNFSFSAEMTGIVIKEMEWFYWPWCLY